MLYVILRPVGAHGVFCLRTCVPGCIMTSVTHLFVPVSGLQDGFRAAGIEVDFADVEIAIGYQEQVVEYFESDVLASQGLTDEEAAAVPLEAALYVEALDSCAFRVYPVGGMWIVGPRTRSIA